MMKCPICNRDVQVTFEVVEEVRPITWGVCMCQTMFHDVGIDKKYFGKLYKKNWDRLPGMKERFEYTQKTYIGLIEELTFGRKFLDVGFALPHTMDFLKERGWITAGVDLIPNDYVQADFETFDIPEKFDYIMFGHCLESFQDPIRAIHKASRLLNKDGILFITHPNPEMIFEIGLKPFGAWNYKQNHIFISKPQLEAIAKRAGFQVIVSHRNISQRYVIHNDLHLVLQKKDYAQ